MTIPDAQGARILDTVAEGPWLLASLVPGKYEIKATYNGTTVTRATAIPAARRREVFFRWDEAR